MKGEKRCPVGLPSDFAGLGALHAPAALGALAPDALIALYGLGAGDTDLRIVLQHRAALFAMMAIAGFAAAAVPRWRPPAAILAGWSMATFLGYYLAAGAPDGPLRKIAMADGAGMAVLLVLGLALWRENSGVGRLATR